jgi:hypothetical protein
LLLPRLRKSAIFLHRWLGVFLCLPFAMWFFSGIVMMYWGYPEVDAADRLARAALLDALRIRVSPGDALVNAGFSSPPRQATIETLAGQPVYRFRLGREQAVVYADTGEPLALPVSRELALRIASEWTQQPASAARFEGPLTREDQWTVSGAFQPLRPLLKFSWPEGEEVYVSALTAQVEQYTTRASRFAAYFGAIPHWLYFTPLRRDGQTWSRVVIWSSGIATFAAILGIVVGAWIATPARRVPYSGMKRWHTILGLFFGVLAATWAFSGMLSMDPFPLVDDDEVAPAIAGALRGGSLNVEAFAGKALSDGLLQVSSGLRVKQIELSMFAGEPVFITKESPQNSRIVPVSGDSAMQFDRRRILEVVAKAVEPAHIVETRWVTDYEAYYLDRQHQHPLPAMFIRLDDPPRSMYYIDPKTARIVAGYSGSGSRWNRWLYHGLHSIDLPWLYKHRPAWDIVVLALLLGGSALAVTSVVLAAQFLRRGGVRSRIRSGVR